MSDSRTPGEGQFSFHAEWYDPLAEMLRPFHIKFFEVDDTVEIYDVKQKRMFVKRVRPTEAPLLGDFYKGATVTIFSRKMKVMEYADKVTADYFASKRARTLAVVLPSGFAHLGKVLSAIHKADLGVGRFRSVAPSRAAAAEFAASSSAAHIKADAGARKGPVDDELAGLLSSGVSLVIEVIGEAVVAKWQALMGPPDGSRDGTMRAAFGPDSVYGSPSRQAADVELEFFFERRHQPTAVHKACSLVVLKPHAVADGSYAAAIDALFTAGFDVTAIRSVQLDAKASEDYLEVYKGVVPEYGRWVAHFASGKSVALEIVGSGVVPAVRELVGPYDPEIARILRPDTLRAKMGRNSTLNVLHCTDVDVDGPLESKFFFHVLDA